MITLASNLVEIKGKQFEVSRIIGLMDSNIRKKLYGLSLKTDQDFVDAYCIEHFKKFGEELAIN